jgi:hypothetical protein
MNESVKDSSQDRRYFTQVCNLIDDLDLSPLGLALYLHYKRWSAAKDKKAPGVKELMHKYKVGARAIKNAKAELVKNRLVKITTFDAKLGKPDEVTILDIWDRNYQHFKELKPAPVVNQQRVAEKAPDLLSDNNSPVVIQQHPPLSDNNTREIKEEEIKGKRTATDEEFADRTATVLETVFDLTTKKAVADSIPESLREDWLEFVKIRKLTIHESKPTAKFWKGRMGFWLTDFRKDRKYDYENLKTKRRELPSAAETIAAQEAARQNGTRADPKQFMQGVRVAGQDDPKTGNGIGQCK